MYQNEVLVTVLMPVFNAEKFLREAIESILNQTFTNFEFLIIDDGSTDLSNQIVKEYSDRRINLIQNNENKGLIETLNIGFSLAKGKYIARMDADDISLPERLDLQFNFLEKNQDIGLLGASYQFLGKKDDTILFPVDYENIKLACLFFNPFCHPTIMIRKEIIEENQLVFKKAYIHAEDYKFWTEVLQVTKAKNLTQRLLLYRVHDSQISQVYLKEQVDHTFLIQKEYLQNLGFNLLDIEIQAIVNCKKPESFEFSDQEVLLTLKSIEKFVFQNKTINFFNEKLLKEYFRTVVKDLFLSVKIINDEVYKLFRSGYISSFIDWTFKQKLKLKINLSKQKLTYFIKN